MILEYYDMDAAIQDRNDTTLVQFKVSSQQYPPSFGPEEVRDILRNATQAILKHERENASPIAGFIVASNRPAGDSFSALQQVVRSLKIDMNSPESLQDFADEPAPSNLIGLAPV